MVYTDPQNIIIVLGSLLILAFAAIILLIFNKVDVDFKGLNKAVGSFSSVFGVQRMPWIIRVYLVLFVVFGFTLLLASILSVSDSFGRFASELFSFSTDSLKLILGAVLGSLSLATERTWRHGIGTDTCAEDQQESIEKETEPPRNNSRTVKNSLVRRKAKSKREITKNKKR